MQIEQENKTEQWRNTVESIQGVMGPDSFFFYSIDISVKEVR